MKFHDPWHKRSRVIIRKPSGGRTDRHEQNNIPPLLRNSHVIQLTGTIFELNSRIKETNVLSKFHENWAKNVTSTVFTCFHNIHIKKNAPPTGGHVCSPIPTIFKLVRDINKTNDLTNFHDDWAKIVNSRVFTMENCHYVHIEKNAMFFHRSRPFSNSSETSLEPIVTSRVFTRKTAPPTGGHVFQRIGTTFELNQDIIKTNILTNFDLGRDFIGTQLLTKFHEDGTRNVASRVFTSKCLRTNGNTTDKDRSQKLTRAISRLTTSSCDHSRGNLLLECDERSVGGRRASVDHTVNRLQSGFVVFH
ncbi:hypothetical protein DPMN_015973 [Dreissena polymorpha]|uniref:Uncharacterized protein n=1 Tax=Dreissena polymorpha TaxID=45954 RepID=A0A9D4NCA3_DREPO|nr:hypothetical protein DPMN_015973 [Dreissena polymorpha]